MHTFLTLAPYALQLLLIIHIIKNAKPFVWLWLLVFVPYIGGIVYLIVEVLPDCAADGRLRTLKRSVTGADRPAKQLAALEKLVQRQGTITNKTLLADAYQKQARYDEAIALYESCLAGPYASDVDIRFKKITALYNAGRRDEARADMVRLKALVPQRNAAHLLLDLELNDDYDAMKALFFQTNNFEAGYRCAVHFHEHNRDDEVATIVAEMKDNLTAYRYLKKTDSNHWYKKTKKLLS
ncbi:MAG: hypothetical protein IJ191_04455 [Treponema sp.]|nr:hypothetical protein [Treponema sp.]